MRNRRLRNGRAVSMPINRYVFSVASLSGWQPTTSEWRSARGLACLNSPSIAEDWAPPLIDISVEDFARITLPVFKVGTRISNAWNSPAMVGWKAAPHQQGGRQHVCAYPWLLQHCPRSSVESNGFFIRACSSTRT